MKKMILMVLLVSAFTAVGFAVTPQIEFVAWLSSAEPVSESSGLLSMRLNTSFELAVRVTPATEIRDQNDFRLGFTDLEPGMQLKVEGIFTDEGVLAFEIDLTQDQHELELKGVLDEINTSPTEIVVSGVRVPVSATADIKTESGLRLNFEDLALGDFVNVEATLVDGEITAVEIKVDTFGTERTRLSFEGVVRSVGAAQIIVFIEGAGEVPVRIHPSTVLKGNLSVGSKVRVFGSIGTDLTVDATEISADAPVRLNPDEVRMGFGQTRQIEILLNQPVSTDTVVALSSMNPSVAEPTSDSILLAAGKLNATFTVQSGSFEGRTLLRAEFPASEGSLVAVLEVEVESDGPDDSPGESDDDELLEIKFSPNQIRGASNQEMVVQLVLNQPAPVSSAVTLAVVEGVGQDVVFPESVVIEEGSTFANVPLIIGSLTGKVKIRATLGSALGGDTASLQIEPEVGQSDTLEVAWIPDQLELTPNEAGSARLTLSQPAPWDLTANLTLREGNVGLAAFPAQVTFSSGESSAVVSFKAGNVEGKIKILAALPFSAGGDTAELEIEVEN